MMSLDHQLPVLVKKAQINGERAQCGLTSMLPMSCRDRAESFARRLNTRLQNLGSSEELARDDTQQLFFNFELDYESPSSPVDEYPSANHEDPFYEATSSFPDHRELLKFRRSSSETHFTNDHKESNSLSSSNSYPNGYLITSKIQPSSRENSERMFSAINLDECARCENSSNGTDEVDFTHHSQVNKKLPSSPVQLINCSPRNSKSPSPETTISLFPRTSKSPSPDDGDSDFESAKSDILDNEEEPCFNDKDNLSIQNSCANESHPEMIEEHIDEAKENTETFQLDDIETWKDIEIVKKPLREDSIDTESSEGDRPQRVRRCSSLKTGKTPPGTPGRKKIVRFADVLGLDLADVKTFMDEIPVIPRSAYDDLANADIPINLPPMRPVQKISDKVLVPLFQPNRDISAALEKQCVCLESATVAAGTSITICGSVRVRNLDFHKTVHVRYTLDYWRTFTDLPASYAQGSCDGYSDRFQFLLYAPAILVGQRLQFAIRFQCKGVQYWDNNSGTNYCYDCLPLGSAASKTLPPADNWQRSFY